VADERELEVPRGKDAIVVRARRHTWVDVLGPHGERTRDASGAPQATFGATPGHHVVQTDGELVRVAAQRLRAPGGLALDDPDAAGVLRVSADAPDQHAVDGVGELPADGTSSCTIAIEKLDLAGAPLLRKRDDDEVFVRTTGGTLQDGRGRRVRSLRLRNGQAEVRLVSEPVPRLVTVEVLAAPPLAGASVRVEFV
jgi:hypothetical protein